MQMTKAKAKGYRMSVRLDSRLGLASRLQDLKEEKCMFSILITWSILWPVTVIIKNGKKH